MKVWLLALILFLPAFSHAGISQQECGNTDLSPQFGPVRFQGESSACFAFVAADLISFNQGLKGKDAVSARDVLSNYFTASAAKFKSWAKTEDAITKGNAASLTAFYFAIDQRQQLGKSTSYKIRDGGSPEQAILAYNVAEGVCSEEKLPSEETLVATDTFRFFENQYLRPHSIQIKDTAPELFEFRKTDRLNSMIAPPRNCAWAQSSPFKAVLTLTEKLNEENLLLIRTHENKICGARDPLRPMILSSFVATRQADSLAAKTIAKVLVNTHTPVGISYDATFLLNGRSAPQKPAGHASSVVGTRWKNGQCQFKIRNTWGASCTPPAYAPEFSGENCDAGNVWINETDLNTRTDGLFIIAPQP